MTAVWGPLGWMTLHSVSTSYPERPTPSERQLAFTWLEMFRDTITCPYCKDHFTSMLQKYRMRYPTMLDSRQNFAMFVFRAHNVVNSRLHKPVYSTLSECMDVLHTNIKTRSAAEYRSAYLNHIYRYWRTIQDISGITALKKIMEMRKVEMDYWSKVDTKFDVILQEDAVTIPRVWVEDGVANAQVPTQHIQLKPSSEARTGFRMIGGRIRLR